MFEKLKKLFGKTGQRDKHDRYRAGQDYVENIFKNNPIMGCRVIIFKHLTGVDSDDPYFRGVMDYAKEKGIFK